MKIFIATILAIPFALNGFSQNPRLIDSLNKVLLTSKEDSTKAIALAHLAEELVYTKPDSCIYYTDLGLELISDKAIRGRFERSENFDLYSFETRMYSRRAVAFSEKRNDLLAIRMAIRTRKVAESARHKNVLRFAQGALAETYQNVGESAIAKDILIEILGADSIGQGRQIWFANLGSCYYDLKQYDSALYYLSKVDSVFYLEKDRPWPFPQLYLGHTYVRIGDHKRAIPYYRTSIAFAEHDNYGYDLCRAFIGIADAFKGLGMSDSAILYANKCFQIANQLSLPAQSLAANTFLADLYESKGMIDSAFKYQKISNTLRDTIFNTDKIKEVQNYTFSEKLRDREIIEEQTAYKNKIRFLSLSGGLVVLLFLMGMLIRTNRHKQKAYALVQSQKRETENQKGKVEKTLEELKATQAQLIQSEKMASLGELTAGIAHEIQNPLNFVNNFSEVNAELIDEMKKEIDMGNISGLKSISDNLEKNTEKIINHGKRADAIVKGMLLHSRETKGQTEPTDINALAEEYLRLSYQGLRARDKSFNTALHTHFDAGIGKINIVPQDIGRVLLNLYNNAFYAVSEKKKEMHAGFEPAVTVSTKKMDTKVEIRVKDNGNGISQKVLDKIFQPFFTTKPTGQGTGLGLSLSYDIIKAHGGEIKVETGNGAGAEFIIQIPLG